MTTAPAAVVVRPATDADVAAVVQLEQECFDAPWGADSVGTEITGTGRHARVATVTGSVDGPEVVGWSSTQVVADTADLLRVAVRPGTRRLGVGRALVDEVVRVGTDAGATRVLLEVAEHNAAGRALYAATGFREIHRRRSYYPDGGDALVLERDLA